MRIVAIAITSAILFGIMPLFAYVGDSLSDETLVNSVLGKNNVGNISYDKEGYELFAVSKDGDSFIMIKDWQRDENGVFGRYVAITKKKKSRVIDVLCTQYSLTSDEDWLVCYEFDYKSQKVNKDRSVPYSDLIEK